MSDLFERMVDRVLKYKPPPQAKKAKTRIAAKKKAKQATKKTKSRSRGGE